MFGLGFNMWLLLIIIVGTYLILIIIINEVVSRWLGVKKKIFFSYNHVNDLHKKVDWTIRITFIIFITIGTYINMHREQNERLWYLETWSLLIVFIILGELLQAFIEWKYVENKKVYISTLIQLGFLIVLMFTVFLITINILD